jgi:hypothetical protein
VTYDIFEGTLGAWGGRRVASDYQACEVPQCGQATVVETDARNT